MLWRFTEKRKYLIFFAMTVTIGVTVAHAMFEDKRYNVKKHTPALRKHREENLTIKIGFDRIVLG